MTSISASPTQASSAERLSEPEIRFLTKVQGLVQATADGRVPFFAAMTNLLVDLKAVRKNDWDIERSAVGTATLDNDGSVQMHPSPAEREFLDDLSGLIDFSVRNGISISSLLASLTHDLVELSTYDWSLEKAKADGFLPKVTGWAKLNREPLEEMDEGVE